MGALNYLGGNLWEAAGATAVDLIAIPYPTRMTIVRLEAGGLWIASPVQLRFEVLKGLTELGPVTHLLAPTPRHQWRLDSWHALFPEAALWSTRRGPATLGGHRLPTTTLSDQAPAAWRGQLDQARFPGYGFEEITFCHRASGTLLVEDLFQAHLPNPRPLVNALVRVGGIGAAGGVPRDMRALARKPAARAWAERVLSWDFDRLVMAHGQLIESDAKAWVSRALDWLVG